jgi:hypothetical protein
MSRNLSILVLGLLAGIAGGALVLAFDRTTNSAQHVDAVGIPKPDSDVKAVLESLRALDQRIARIEADLASRGASAARAPVLPAAGSADPPEPIATSSKEWAALRADLLRVSERLAAMEEGLKDSGLRWIRNPTQEQLQRARKGVNWALVNEIDKTCRDPYPAALERVSAMTIDDVLEQIGAPTRTGQGAWYYVRALDSATPWVENGIVLSFSGDHVVGVSAVGVR